MVSYEGQLVWRAFAAMLTANAVLATIAGLLPRFLPKAESGAQLIAGVGLAICAAWFFVLRRQFAYYRYWFTWVRHFERRYLKPEVQITTLGKTYGEGGSIDHDSETPELPKFSWTARVFRVEWLMMMVVFAFALIYALILKAAPIASQTASPVTP